MKIINFSSAKELLDAIKPGDILKYSYLSPSKVAYSIVVQKNINGDPSKILFFDLFDAYERFDFYYFIIKEDFEQYSLLIAD